MTTPTPSTAQVLLPGQTSAAEGPHDQTGMYLMHHAFRRDLVRFESAVRNTPVTADRVWRALAARWDRFAEVLHHHHTIEDTAIWPVLLDGVRDDPADTATLHAMESEHAHVDPALAACHTAFAAMAAHPCDDHRNALDVHVTSLRSLLLDHLRHEETEALPMVQRVMTDEQFAASEAAAAEGYPPRMVPFVVPWVCDEVPVAVITPFLAKAGAVYGLLLRLLRPGHARRERRAFRYA